MREWIFSQQPMFGLILLAKYKRDHAHDLPDGYTRVDGFSFNSNCYFVITDFMLNGNDTVKISFSINSACNVFGCYTSADATTNYSLYASTSSGAKYLRYANGVYASYFSSENQGRRFDVTITPKGTTGMPTDSTWTASDFTGVSDFCIGTTSVGASSAKLKGNIYGDIIVVGRLHLIPCERTSDNTLGYYDKVSDTFYEPATGTPTVIGG